MEVDIFVLHLCGFKYCIYFTISRLLTFTSFVCLLYYSSWHYDLLNVAILLERPRPSNIIQESFLWLPPDGADINTIAQQQVVRGYHLGRMITFWKCNGPPGWMERPELKRRLGFDVSLNAKEAKFAARCRHLKAWKLRHSGTNPGRGGKNGNRDQEEKRLYMFQWATHSGERNHENMQNPKLRALFEEAYAIGH